MFETLDQIFILLKQGVLGLLPQGIRPLASCLLTVSAVFSVFGLLFAVTTLVERKALGRIQNRLGPNRVGPFGLLQPVADGIKMLTKENIVPRAADRLVHFLAPVVLIVPVALAFSVLPYGRNMVPVELDAGLLFFFAVGASTELAVFMAGWSSRNKYALLGAMRGIAQMISYEIPLVLSTLAVVMVAGTLSLPQIVSAQGGYLFGWIPQWHVLTPWGLAGFVLFLIAATAESNRAPFDLPEAESELVAGYFTEYSGFKFALFFLGEYWGLFAVSGLAVTFFLGGWHAPLPMLQWVPSWLWFFGKLLFLLSLFIWVRGTVPRLRTDQLMNYAWKFLLPLTLVNLVAAAAWHYSRSWDFPAALLWRWLACAAIIAIPYVLLGAALGGGRQKTQRIYRYAD